MKYQAILYAGDDPSYEPRAVGESERSAGSAMLAAEDAWVEKFGEDTGYSTHWEVLARGERLGSDEVSAILSQLSV